MQMTILALIVMLASLFAARVLLYRPVDTDTFWHLKTGEWIVENGRIPATDVFSWIGAEKGLTWTPHEWLFDVAMWSVYSSMGFVGIYALTAIAYGSFVLLVFLLAYRRSGQWILSLIMATISMLGVATFLSPRPQVVTYVLLTAVAVLLEMRRPYLAVLITLVGINMHGAVYPVYLGVFAFYCLPRQDWKPLSLAALCTVLTPIGLRLLPWPLFALDSHIALFQEYAPTVLAHSWFLLLAFIAAFVLVDRERLPVWDGLLVLVVALMALFARRHATLFFGIAWPVLAPFVSLPQSPTSDGAPHTKTPAVGSGRDLDKMLALVLAMAVLVSIAQIRGSSIDPDRGFPAEAATWIKQQGVTRIWNGWGEGGYLIYRGVPTFVDGRGDPFMPFLDSSITIGRDAADAHYIRIDPRVVVEKYGISHILVDRQTPLYQVLRQSRDFKAVYRDNAYAVFATRLAPSLSP
jgi:hypothetical protein